MMVGFFVTLTTSLPAQNMPDLEAEETPLHWAAEHGLYSIAERLIQNGARANAPDQFGRTPLHRAVPYPDLVALLLESGAGANTADMFGRTPLHAALQYPFTVVLLLDAGADISAQDFLGDTPLERTLRYGTRSRNLEVISLLLGAGAGAPSTGR
jgi:ankyrin repeat protein